MQFSQRKGFKKYSTLVQTNGMSEELRNSLWNILFSRKWDFAHIRSDDAIKKITIVFKFFSEELWFHYFKKPIDTRPHEFNGFTQTLNVIRTYFMTCEWYEVYDFLEFTLDFYFDEDLTKAVNAILENELSGYRFIDGVISDITDPQELEMLEQALSDNDFPAVKAHLKRALELLSDRESPDYRNSIKESISAVESVAKVLSDNPKATLGDALRFLGKKGKIHPSLKDGFLKLYGYTSDEGGIRHAMLDEPNLSASDAKFFLLACTNFVNYLKSKA